MSSSESPARILVTGGAGFMGSWLVDELVRRGNYVVSVDDLSGGYLEFLNPRAKFHRVNLMNFKSLDRLVKQHKIQIIFHLAAHAHEGLSIFSPITINNNIVIPMHHLLVCAVNHGVERFVFTSSTGVYGNQSPPFSEDMPRAPLDPYGAAKAYCEQLLEIFHKIHGLEYVIIRPHSVYGPRQNLADPYRNVIGIWINRILRGLPPYIYGDGNQKRAFSYIEDITPALANAGFYPEARNQIINLGSEEVITINQACRIVLETMGSDLEPVYLEPRPHEVKYAYCTTEKSKKLLGYRTSTPFREGVRKMVEWAIKFGARQPKYTIPLEITKNAPRVWVEKMI